MNTLRIVKNTKNLYCAYRGLSYTHFGFENVNEDDKQGKVNAVFENVATKYDLMNDAMSGGIHRLWKDCFVNQTRPYKGLNCLDVAGGTGDIAFRLVKHAQDLNSSEYNFHVDNPYDAVTGQSGDADLPKSEISDPPQVKDIHVTVCDINPAMIKVGQQRAEKKGLTSALSWVEGNAEKLPFEDNSFDLYTIAFGIRNCTHIQKVLDEAFRVLRPCGRFMCLEFSRVNNPLLRRVYDEYSFQVIPVMGQIIASDWHSYKYLVESIRRFPSQSEFATMLQTAGFSAVHFTDYTGGVCAVHSGFKMLDTDVD